MLVPENLAGPISEILAGFRTEDRDEEERRSALQGVGAVPAACSERTRAAAV